MNTEKAIFACGSFWGAQHQFVRVVGRGNEPAKHFSGIPRFHRRHNPRLEYLYTDSFPQ